MSENKCVIIIDAATSVYLTAITVYLIVFPQLKSKIDTY